MVALLEDHGLVIGGLRPKYPIIQGGMGVGISLSGLASAVAREGGIGVVAAAGIGVVGGRKFFSGKEGFLTSNTEMLKSEITKAKEMAPGGIIGVNIMQALEGYQELVKAADEAGADIIFCGGGLPRDMPGLLSEGSKTRLVPIVSSARLADFFCKHWQKKYGRLPDAIVVEGPKAGGHLGFSLEEIEDPRFALESLIPQVIQAARGWSDDIPVIAAGGIYTGGDILKFLKLGASGVQMGTRFVTTEECDASDKFKEEYIQATKDDIVIVKSPMGMPGRAIKNDFLVAAEAGEKKPSRCDYECIKKCNLDDSPYCIFWALINAYKGKLNLGFTFAGVNAWRATEIIPVHELMATIVKEYEEAGAKASLISRLVNAVNAMSEPVLAIS